jgi:hypothetical protein
MAVSPHSPRPLCLSTDISSYRAWLIPRGSEGAPALDGRVRTKEPMFPRRRPQPPRIWILRCTEETRVPSDSVCRGEYRPVREKLLLNHQPSFRSATSSCCPLAIASTCAKAVTGALSYAPLLSSPIVLSSPRPQICRTLATLYGGTSVKAWHVNMPWSVSIRKGVSPALIVRQGGAAVSPQGAAICAAACAHTLLRVGDRRHGEDEVVCDLG